MENRQCRGTPQPTFDAFQGELIQITAGQTENISHIRRCMEAIESKTQSMAERQAGILVNIASNRRDIEALGVDMERKIGIVHQSIDKRATAVKTIIGLILTAGALLLAAAQFFKSG